MTELLSLQGEPVAVKLYEPQSHRGDAILIHGFTGSKEDFDYIGPLLADRGYRVATFDNRGQYQSPHSDRDGAYTTQSLGRDAVELAALLGMKKVNLLGHSFGGLVLQQAVLQSPATWGSLTMMCSGPENNPNRANTQKISKELPALTMESYWNLHMAEGYASHVRPELMRERWLASDKRSVLSHAHHLLNDESFIEQIAALGIPAHVLYGANDDAWPLEVQEKMARDLSAPVTVISDAGHCPNEDQPTATAKAIADFWDSI
jgi:pimeloyl-ACP methyl ester carboxylesterase